MKKVLKIFCLCSGCGFILTGCGNKEYSEKEILNMVKEHVEYYYDSCEFDQWDLEMYDRMTDTEEKMDYVWVSASADNDVSYLNLNYEITFSLWDDGWRMDSIDVEDYSYGAYRTTITEEEARNYIEDASDYDNITFINQETNLNYGSDYYTYEGDRYSEYLDREVTDIIEVRFYHSVYDGWYYVETKYKKDDVPDFSAWDSGMRVAPKFQ